VHKHLSADDFKEAKMIGWISFREAIGLARCDVKGFGQPRAILQIRATLMEPIDETLHQGILTLATAAATSRSLPGGQRLRVHRGYQVSVAHQG